MTSTAQEWAAQVTEPLQRSTRIVLREFAARAGEDGAGQVTTAELLEATGYKTRDTVDQVTRRAGNLLRDLGGTLAWHPEPGVGSRYYFQLPPAARSEPAAAAAGEHPAGGALGQLEALVAALRRAELPADAEVTVNIVVHLHVRGRAAAGDVEPGYDGGPFG